MASLLQRLKERKLVQWALAYLAGAWALVEATNLVGEQFHWPAVIGQVVTVVALFGFFVILVLAWYHGEKGRQRVSGPELLMIALLLVLTGAALNWVDGPSVSSDPVLDLSVAGDVPPDPLAIAVLPVTNMAGSEDEFLAEGLQDDLISQLHLVGSFTKVISRTSTMRYRDTKLSVPEIAKELGVGSIVEASVRRAGGRILVLVQLIDAANDTHLWTERYDDRSERDIFDIQADITQRIAQALRATITADGEERIARPPTDNWEAYQLYLEARHFFHQRGEEPLRRSIELFQAAIAEDPDFAEAYAGLAGVYVVLPGYVPPFDSYPEVYPLAESAAEKAIALDPDLAEPYGVRGMIFDYRRMWAAAAEEFRMALELAPQNSNVLLWSAFFEARVGRFDKALDRLRKAYDVDPASPPVNGWLARVHKLRGEHEPQLLFARRAHDDLGYARGLDVCEALLWSGRLDEADSLCPGFWPAEYQPLVRSFISGLRSPSGHALAVESVSGLPRGDRVRFWELLDEADSIMSDVEGSSTPPWGVPGSRVRGDPRFKSMIRNAGLLDYWRESSWPENCSPVGEDDFECH